MCTTHLAFRLSSHSLKAESTSRSAIRKSRSALSLSHLLQMSGEKLSLEQFSALLKNIDSGLGLAASQLWKEGVNTEALLRKLTKQDMHMAGINLGNRVLIYDHFHPTDAGHLQTVVVDKTARKYEPVEDEISLAGVVDMLLWHIWRCIDMYDQGPKLGEDKTSEAELEKALEELSTKLKEWGAAVHGKVEYLLCYACAGSQFQMRAEEEHQVYTSCVEASPSHQWDIPESAILVHHSLYGIQVRTTKVDWVYHTSLLDRCYLCKLAHPLLDHALAAWLGGLGYDLLGKQPLTVSTSPTS
ncbi:hypothetical protein WJX77_003516 [Trebouxia sp. C0004]